MYAPASTAKIPEDLQAALSVNPVPALFFGSLKSAARYEVLHGLETAKKRDTQELRIRAFITSAAEHNETDSFLGRCLGF